MLSIGIRRRDSIGSAEFFYGRYFSPTLKLKWSEQVISKEYVRLRDVRSKHHEACRSRM